VTTGQGVPEQSAEEFPHLRLGLDLAQEFAELGRLGFGMVGGSADFGDQVGRVVRLEMAGVQVDGSVRRVQ
jgi:hypothetical protein